MNYRQIFYAFPVFLPAYGFRLPDREDWLEEDGRSCWNVKCATAISFMRKYDFVSFTRPDGASSFMRLINLIAYHQKGAFNYMLIIQLYCCFEL